MKFSDLNLDSSVLEALTEVGYTDPTPIQMQAIPEILKGSDLLASAQTGTGKTAAYILPALTRMVSTAPRNTEIGPRILILVPTRELAMQVALQAEKYSRGMKKMKTVCIYGGAPYPVQNRQLSRPYEILVATPGRLMDHLDRGRINLSRVEMFILDEADRMLDMGFIDDVETIAEEVPDNAQTLLFSATMKKEIIKLSKNLLEQPVEIHLTHEKSNNDNVDQFVQYTQNLGQKMTILEHYLREQAVGQTIIFTSTKVFANQLVEELIEKGYSAAALHGDLTQPKRTKTIAKMRSGKFRILVATDVASRGIDIPDITHVINFDFPDTHEDYIHRIGRTGRAQARGTALSFTSSKDYKTLKSIEEVTGKKMALLTMPGIDLPVEEPVKAKANHNRNSRPRRPQGSSSARRSSVQSSSGSRDSAFTPSRSNGNGNKGPSSSRRPHAGRKGPNKSRNFAR